MRYCDYKRTVEQLFDTMLNDCCTYNDCMEALANWMDDNGYMLVMDNETYRDHVEQR